jgi:hypothetical protein
MPAKHFTSEVGKVANWTYKARVKTKKGSWAVYIVNKDDNTIRLQLNKQHGAKCTIPFGISCWDDDPTKTRKNLEISLPNDELVSFFSEIDEYNINQGILNSKEWFKSQLSREEVELKYKKLVQQPDEKWNPRIRTKVNIDSGRYPLRVLNYVSASESSDNRDHLKPGTPSDITKGSKAILIIKISALWFMNNQYGMTIETTDVLLYSSNERDDFDFLCSGDDDVKTSNPTILQSPPTSSVLFIDSEPAAKKQKILKTDINDKTN